MINHIWSIICKKSVIDSETNNISLYEALESIQVSIKVLDDKSIDQELFNIPIEYEIVSLWENKTPEKKVTADVSVEVTTNKGDVLKTFSKKLEMEKNMKRLRSRMRISGMSIPGSDQYSYKIKLKQEGDRDFKLVAELPLEVALSFEK